MKNIFNFFNLKTEYNQIKDELNPDAINFVADEHRIYAKNNWFGGSGDGSGSGSGESTIIENPYDDTEVRGLISGVNSRLDNLVLLTQQDVQNTVTSMIADMRSFIDNFGWDAMFNDSGWDEEMRAYIQTVGFTDSENNQVSWSQFYQDFKTLQSVVSQINIGGTDEDINYETIQAMINSTIDGNTAINEIKSKWALAAENEKVLKWLASGFSSQASQYGSFSSMYAASNSAINDNINGLSNSLQTTNDAIAALQLRVNNDEISANRVNTAVAALSTRVNNIAAGYVSETSLDNATSAIYSRIDDNEAIIATTVKQDENGNVTSSIKFGADNVELNEDGSGMIAGGALRWTDDGEFYLGDYLRLDTNGIYSGDDSIEISFDRNDIYAESVHADNIGGETLNLWHDIRIYKQDPYDLSGQEAADNMLAILNIDDYGKIALQKDVYNGVHYDSVDDSKFILNLATGELSVDHIIADGGASTFDSVNASYVYAGRITTSNFYTAGNPARFEDGAVFEDDIVAEDVQCENLEVTSLKVPSTSGAVTVGSATGYTGDVDFVDTQGIHKMAYFRNGILTGISTIIASGSFEESGDPDSF